MSNIRTTKVQFDRSVKKNTRSKKKQINQEHRQRDKLMVQEVAKESMGKVMESYHGGVLEGEVVVGEEMEELEEEDDDDLVLPGFRFHPTDEELVTFYLRRKVAGKRLSIEIIKEMDIYKHEPWDFPKASTIGGDKEWYFFCLRGRKYRNSVRPNRVTGAGFWKATGIDRPIHSAGRRGGGCIGLKKSLVYYRGSAGKGTKTEWMMHEFRLPPHAAVHSSPCFQEAEVWTICRIFKRNITYKKQPQQVAAAPQPDSSSVTAGSLESDCTGDDEYMNRLQAPAVNNVNYNGYGGKNFQGQWDSSVQPATPQPLPVTAALYPSALSPAVGTNDGCWDDIGRMVMELTDPSVFYDCRYAC